MYVVVGTCSCVVPVRLAEPIDLRAEEDSVGLYIAPSDCGKLGGKRKVRRLAEKKGVFCRPCCSQDEGIACDRPPFFLAVLGNQCRAHLVCGHHAKLTTAQHSQLRNCEFCIVHACGHWHRTADRQPSVFIGGDSLPARPSWAAVVRRAADVDARRRSGEDQARGVLLRFVWGTSGQRNVCRTW